MITVGDLKDLQELVTSLDTAINAQGRAILDMKKSLLRYQEFLLKSIKELEND